MANFTTSLAQRFVINWFNRRPIGLLAVWGSNQTTASASLVELNTATRAEFLTWGQSTVYGFAAARMYTGTAGNRAWLNISLDTTTYAPHRSLITTPTANYETLGYAPYMETPSEGYHYFGAYGASPDGGGAVTATFIGGASADGGLGGILYDY